MPITAHGANLTNMNPESRRKTFSSDSSHQQAPDLVLVLLVVLLLLTLGAFLGGWLGYPYGILVLSFLIAGRVIQQRRGSSSAR